MHCVVGYASQIGIRCSGKLQFSRSIATLKSISYLVHIQLTTSSDCKEHEISNLRVGRNTKNLPRSWRHLECISKKQTTQLRSLYDEFNIHALEGYVDLRALDQATVQHLLEITESDIYLSWTGEEPRTPKPDISDLDAFPALNLTVPKVQSSKSGALPVSAPYSKTAQTPQQRCQGEEVSGADLRQAKHPTSAEGLKDLGNAYFQQESYEMAIDMYSQVIALGPNPIFYTNRAAAYMALKRFKWALNDCQSAAVLQVVSPSYKTLGRLAKCHLALGDPHAVMKAAQEAIECAPSWATRASAELMQQYLDESRDARGSKSWEQAKSSLHKAAELCEGVLPPQWCVWKVEIEMAMCNWTEAATLSKNAVQMHPDSVDVQAMSAHVELLNNCLSTCPMSLKSAVHDDPHHQHARGLLSRIEGIIQAKEAGDRLFGTGRFTEASTEYTKALNILGCKEEEGHGGPLRFALLTNRSATYPRMLRFDLAWNDCKVALTIPNQPSQLRIFDRLAICCLAQGDPEGALEHVRTALDLDPLDPALLKTKSAAEKMQGNIRLSRQAWAKKDWSVSKDALDCAAAGCAGNRSLQWWYWKMEAEKATRCWDDAVTTAQLVVALHPNSPRAFTFLGLTLMFSDKLALCPPPLQSALRLDPDDLLAVGTLRRAQDIDKGNEEGNRASRWGQYSEAVEKYTETLKMWVMC
ncbi:hypothetical protein FRB94_001966 [Tulasnella sp. JGI-2019a]|nr:hypothetical protein FRB94_001966 [Tulasnella sp. JGI-2019a]